MYILFFFFSFFHFLELVIYVRKDEMQLIFKLLFAYQLMNTTQRRWFVLTDRRLTYYREESGELMACLPLPDIDRVIYRGVWVCGCVCVCDPPTVKLS